MIPCRAPTQSTAKQVELDATWRSTCTTKEDGLRTFYTFFTTRVLHDDGPLSTWWPNDVPARSSDLSTTHRSRIKRHEGKPGCCLSKVLISDSRVKVAFSSVEIKVYPYILGDNPSVSKGSPLTIDWEPMAVQVYDSVDAYETARGGEGYAPRDHFNLLMPMELRESYIRQTDYTQTERRLHARPSIFPRAIENNPSPRMTSNQNRIINLKSRCARSAMSHGGEAPNKKNDT